MKLEHIIKGIQTLHEVQTYTRLGEDVSVKKPLKISTNYTADNTASESQIKTTIGSRSGTTKRRNRVLKQWQVSSTLPSLRVLH
jgi:hypothetical protein